MASEPRKSWALFLTAALVVIAAAVLRFAYIDSDPPHGLSASRAEYTDEGLKFYQARNRALFGRWRIQTPWAMQGHLKNSPVPTVLGWGVFEAFGVGRVQARCMSAVSGVLSCAVMMLIGFRSKRPGTGLLAGAFLAGNFISVWYDRLALFESLFVFLLLCAALFYLEGGWRRWTLAPLFLALAYLTRPTAVAVAAAFALAFLVELWRASSWNLRRKVGLLLIVCAFLIVCAVVFLRLSPSNQIISQIKARLMTPYFQTFPPVTAAADLLVRTFADSLVSAAMPLLAIFALLALVPRLPAAPGSSRRDPRPFFSCWLVAVIFLLAFLEYRPTRYYTIMIPSLAWLAADWLVLMAEGASALPLTRLRAVGWAVLRFFAGTQIAGVLLRWLLGKRYEFPMFLDVDASGLKHFQDFIESCFIGTGKVLQPHAPAEVAVLAENMRQHVIGLSLCGLAVLGVSILWLLIRKRFLPGGLPARVRFVAATALAFVIVVGQGGLLLDSLSRSSRRYQVRSAERSVLRLIGDNPRACVAGNWAPSLCMGSPYLTLPFARGNGNAWQTFQRFPVTHFLLEMNSVNEERYLAGAYPAQYARCRLLEVFTIDVYEVGLFEYQPLEGVPLPPWPFDKRAGQ